MRRLPALALMLALPGGAEQPVGQPVEAISVTPLPDAPPATPSPPDPPEADPAPDAAPPEADVAPAETPAEAIPAPPPSPEQLACERRGGRFMRAGDTGLMACVQPTRDAGQQCRRGSDCDGECLARSGTCAPFTPLFGCHEILLDTGARVTQCLD